MGLLDVVDSVLGSDLSGKKARGAIDKAAAQANAANAAAMQVIKQYGDKALQLFEQYLNRGLNESEALHAAARDSLVQYGGEAGRLYEDRIREGMDASNALYEAATAALQQGAGGAKDILQQYYNQAQAARRPLNEQAASLLDAIPALKAALGLPSDWTYDVSASPLYGWQKNQLDERLTAQMNAMGQANSPAAAYIRSKNLQQLGAEERNRQIADLMNTANMGLGYSQNLGQLEMGMGQALAGLQGNEGQALAALLSGQGNNMLSSFGNLGQGLATIKQDVGSGLANTLNQEALNRSGIYSNMGSNIGQTLLGIGGNLAQGQIGMGQNLLNAGLSKAAMPNSMNQLINAGLQLYGLGAFGGGSRRGSNANLGLIGRTQTVNMGLPIMYGLSGIPF